MDWRDRIIGIVLGVVLGVAVVVAFVFLLSGETVDAPSLSSGAATTSTTPHQASPKCDRPGCG